MLMNEEGEVTSHLQGFFNRCANLLEAGIKPVFVFDGRPPTLKSGELAKRKEAKEKAEGLDAYRREKNRVSIDGLPSGMFADEPAE